MSACIASAWKTFHKLQPILTDKGISLVNRGKVFKACVTSVLLSESETWPLSTEDFSQIKKCDDAMIRWLCNVNTEQKHSTEDLRRRIMLIISMMFLDGIDWGCLFIYIDKRRHHGQRRSFFNVAGFLDPFLACDDTVFYHVNDSWMVPAKTDY